MEEILSRVAGGDARAMDELFALEHDSMRRFFVRLCRCESRADDLLQNTFLNLWRYRDQLGRRRSPSGYLYTVALNQWRSANRSEKRQRELVESKAREAEPRRVESPEESLLAEERVRAVRNAVSRLPKPQQQVFLLHRYHGLSCSEIAERTKAPLKTVESRLRLALEKLTNTLKSPEPRR